MCITNRADTTEEVQLERAVPGRLYLEKQNKPSELLQKETALGNLKAKVSDSGESSTSEKMGQLEIWNQPKGATKWSPQLAAKLTDICIYSMLLLCLKIKIN